ncbi:MAG: general negative regulator of transcription subunit 5 [Claussenomyces sp. TS43310]|nr:MAG: general negative regulator of transcription subunit 5 [Claussenomyces sp. TS43310]
MAARKLQQEVDKCFKKVSEGVAEFESIYEKIEQSTNAAQKEKLEDNLKREIKKLQRLRDQIKTWAASNDIKDKSPLLENRKLIETQMEKFKAVEKAMKTKAFSKEGLSAATKLDPKEAAKLEACEFLGTMVDELERQIETLEAEGESIQATMKKGKNQSSKADRMAEIERITERHKWHQGKLELIKRSLENGGVETEQVNDLEESIKYYVSDGMNEDFMEDDEMYDDLNLQEEEDAYGMNNDNDRVSSQDTQSVQEEGPEDTRSGSTPGTKSKGSAAEPPTTSARRPSAQLKSPLPALATLHTPLSNMTNGSTASNMKPASIPTRAPGETLKYASAAAAAAVNNVGIAPLPPPPSTNTPSTITPSLAPLPPAPKSATTESPTVTSALPATTSHTPSQKPSIPVTASLVDQSNLASKPSPASNQATAIPNGATSNISALNNAADKVGSSRSSPSRVLPGKQQPQAESVETSKAQQSHGPTNGIPDANGDEVNESIYHLPSGFQDLMLSFEITQSRASLLPSQSTQRMMDASFDQRINAVDAEQPRYYKPKYRFNTPSYYPQEPLSIFDDPRLYSRVDPDALFYVFYYRQGTYQQYLAARALKDQSWRFHKQYQTWFQRHEEPKTITEEFEQGTYRFFDYESTWMNRRKADFKFAYKFLEDDV